MEKNRAPVVSIIMATYNRADILRRTVANIFEQDYPHFELIVIDDGSVDATSEVLQVLQEQYNFSVIRNSPNAGLQKSLNRGIRTARGKYIARIDDHDLWIQKNKLSLQVDYLDRHPEIGLVGTAYRTGEKVFINPLTDAEIRAQILLRCPFCHVTIMMRKSVLTQVGNYDENLPYSEDWDLWLKIGTQTQFANLPDVTTETAEEVASLSDSYFLKQLPLNRRLVSRYFSDYSGSTKAMIYHNFLRVFFGLFKVNGRLHNLMKRVFTYRFSSRS